MIHTSQNPIRTDASNTFAHRTVRERIPALIRETQVLNPDYTPEIQAALDRLYDELVNNAPIALIQLPAPDFEAWQAEHQPYANDTWQATNWFFAEVYFYRRVMEAVRWWETGRDPFAPKKAEEYASPALWDLLHDGLAVRGTPEERLGTLIEYALWGNRIDLSYALAASHGSQIHADDILTDDRAIVVEHLLHQRGSVHIIADNAGSELTMDLVLAAALLEMDIAPQVILHLKLHPTFVSDATVPDVIGFIRHISTGQRGADAQSFGEQLEHLLNQGRLRLAPDAYWNSTRFLNEIPARLQQVFNGSALAIIKGDANYRRMVSDTIWAAHTPMADVVNYFPCPLLALRTLKSDPVIGLPAGLADKLDHIDNQWRVNGQRAVLQSTLKG